MPWSVIKDKKGNVVDMASDIIDRWMLLGYGFQIQKRFTLASGATLYLAFDAALSTGLDVVTMQVNANTNNGCVFFDSYYIDSVSGGTDLTVAGLNPDSKIYSKCTMKTGVTPSGTPAYAREYVIGSLGTNQASGGGSVSSEIMKIAAKNKPIIFKFVNQETSVNTLTLGFTWYEVPQ